MPSHEEDQRELIMEAREASWLADALEGRKAPDVDRDVLDAALLLQALSRQSDAVAARRTRLELVARAPRLHARRVWQRVAVAVAAALVVGILGGILWHGSGGATDRLLAQRELAAERAVARVASGWSPETAQAARLRSAFDDTWRARLSTKVATERATLLVKQSSTSSHPGNSGTGTTL
jgi:hypothetical protein